MKSKLLALLLLLCVGCRPEQPETQAYAISYTNSPEPQFTITEKKGTGGSLKAIRTIVASGLIIKKLDDRVEFECSGVTLVTSPSGTDRHDTRFEISELLFSVPPNTKVALGSAEYTAQELAADYISVEGPEAEEMLKKEGLWPPPEPP